MLMFPILSTQSVVWFCFFYFVGVIVGFVVNAHFLREGKQALEQAQKKLEDLDDDIKLLLEAQALEEE